MGCSGGKSGDAQDIGKSQGVAAERKALAHIEIVIFPEDIADRTRLPKKAQDAEKASGGQIDFNATPVFLDVHGVEINRAQLVRLGHDRFPITSKFKLKQAFRTGDVIEVKYGQTWYEAKLGPQAANGNFRLVYTIDNTNDEDVPVSRMRTPRLQQVPSRQTPGFSDLGASLVSPTAVASGLQGRATPSRQTPEAARSFQSEIDAFVVDVPLGVRSEFDDDAVELPDDEVELPAWSAWGELPDDSEHDQV